MKYPSLENKVVVVTGASSGLGEALARGFALEGSIVYLCARRFERLETIAADIQKTGGRAYPVQLDVTNPEKVMSVAEKVVGDWGRVDIWVNNAGIGYSGSFVDMPVEKIQEVVGVNLFGSLYGTKAAAKYMLPRRTGDIVNVLSTSSYTSRTNETAYCSAKAGVEMQGNCAQKELEPFGIRVTQVFPGAIASEFQANAGLTPPPNPLPPADVADAILYAVSLPRFMRLEVKILRNPPKASR